MSRPAQVEEQMKRVLEIQEEMQGKGTPPVDPNVVVPPEPVVAPQEPVTAPVVSNSPATISQEEYNKLEQRYRTLQGMHNAETSRLRADLASAIAAIDDLEDRLTNNTSVAAPAAPTKYVTEEHKREYGESLDVMRLAAREEAEEIAATRETALLGRIAQLEQQLGHVNKTVVPKVEDIARGEQERIKSEFWGAINAQVPDWRTINDDVNFKAWLLAEDPITGATRQQFLDQARNAYNAPRVIKFFEEWKRNAAGGQTPAPKNTAQTQAELEKLVAPGVSRAGATPGTPEKKKWTGADIENFYKEVKIGRYIGREAERQAIENDLFAAQAEGRVIKS